MTGWADVERYLVDTVVHPDGALVNAVEATAHAGMPAIEVTPTQGKFLMLLAKIAGARRVLEIGTLGGFSTIWLARGIPDDGTVDTCEYEQAHADVARRNLDLAGVGKKVTIHVGAALDTLPTLAGPYDLFFIDADKVNNPRYLDWAIRLSRPGSVIVLDNVVRGGSVLEAHGDEAVQGTRGALELLGLHPQLEATALQTVGSKDWDGLALAVVVAAAP
ncbi:MULTISPECIES: O-methyltransferase [unclassified Arthrobacter]|uniref:O-methyltransferase n=1 Tax=unclassified Arthrobacter TaxID=235627 RepID=UPI001491E4A8|nr:MULTISPECIES: O-methyltransferase [unclassified Arthrobacter]MBE0008332.1 O-methyltransferase [Arthrobacter sp. AET 35A]NOJ62071.1 O-methyltransferase [Arthrobacter sp. 147(2020)]